MNEQFVGLFCGLMWLVLKSGRTFMWLSEGADGTRFNVIKNDYSQYYFEELIGNG